MFKSVEDIKNANKKLNEIQTKWFNELKLDTDIIDKFNKNHKNTKRKYRYELSLPFYSGLSEKAVGKKIIMVIGQESRNSGRYNTRNYNYTKTIKSQDWCLPNDSSKWSVAYLEKQILNVENKEFEIDNDSYPFWRFIKRLFLDTKEFFPFWTNLDKLHTYQLDKNTDEVKACCSLYEETEKILHKKINDKTLLEYEIDIVKPEIILFLTGENYENSMKIGLGLDKDFAFKDKLRKDDKIIIPLENVTNIQQKVFWTFHPRTLKSNEKFDIVIDKIKENL